MNYNVAIMEAAKKYLGVAEHPGKASNPVVESFFARSGHPGLTDEVPWCAAFVGSVLAECGLPNSGSLMARSYERYGQSVALRDARPGDIVVLERGEKPAGHVGFFVRWVGDEIVLRGGNQKDKVSDTQFRGAAVVVIRRADPVASVGRATLRQGDRGALVLDLQMQLQKLHYFAGKLDGDFGQLTAAAVMAFQNDNPALEADGIVGTRTWTALAGAEPKPDRDVTMKDLRVAEEKTVLAADKIDVIGTVTAGGTALATLASVGSEATSSLGMINTLVTQYWQSLLVIGLALGVIYFAKQVRSARLQDARSGANVSK
jgi:uncharacterized protein (TIGR02594 family)